jgi:hypothetical protein
VPEDSETVPVIRRLAASFETGMNRASIPVSSTSEITLKDDGKEMTGRHEGGNVLEGSSGFAAARVRPCCRSRVHLMVGSMPTGLNSACAWRTRNWWRGVGLDSTSRLARLSEE